MNRQRLILFVLAIMLIAAVVWAYFAFPRQKTVSPLKYPPGSHLTAEKKRPQTKPVPQTTASASSLRLDLLSRDAGTFKGYQRDLFKPIFVDEVKLMKEKSAAKKPALPSAAQAQRNTPPGPPPAVVPPPVSTPETPQRELARFTFLGFLKKDSRQTIFLSKDKDILLVKKGDTFAGRYQATSITDQALTIQVTDTGEEIVIPLVESRPLASAQPSPPPVGRTP